MYYYTDNLSDPRESNPFGRSYTVDCLGNMVGGKRIIYNNQPIEVLMNLTRNSIMANEAVWFGCEVSKRLVLFSIVFLLLVSTLTGVGL